MFSIFKKKTNSVTDISWLGVDIHSHLLPGIDDGSPNINTSVALITQLHKLGLNKFICTPHIFTELYPNTPETISPVLLETQLALKRENLNVNVAAAAEYMIDETFDVKPGLMTLPGNYILIEMSYLNESPNIEQVIFDLQIAGYQVILAHPERYIFYHKAHERFHRFKDMGVLFQLNLLSISGYYGKQVKQSAEYLIENKYYDLAATDLHHEKHLHALTLAVTSGYLYQKIGSTKFKNRDLFG